MRVLILGGTTEASAIARALAGDGRFAPVLSLAGRTRIAGAAADRVGAVGGFGGRGGVGGVSAARKRVEALIDATHPFAAQMKAHAVAASVRPCRVSP